MLSRLRQFFSRRLRVKKSAQRRESMGEFSAPSSSDRPWIGVDLDGTLAKDGKWVDLQHIGQPVEPMMKRVREWTAQGITVKIFTARAGEPNGILPVKAWLEEQGLPNLEVTNEKDFNMIALWDDRAIQVIANTGIPVLNQSTVTSEKALPTSNRDRKEEGTK